MADGKVVIETGLDSSGIEKELGKLGGLVKTGLSAAVGVIAGVSTALVDAGVASVKFGSDFESSMAKASTLFGDVNVNTDNLNSKILELSGSTGVAASEIGNSLYNALSAGIPATEDMGTAMTYMEQCTKLAKAGFTDVDTVVTSTAKVLNAYKMDVDQTDKVHKILMQTQNKGITTVGELGASLAQVTPTAAAMNVSFEQVGAALATMTAQGTPTAQATTQLNSLFAELGKQGTIASKSLEKATEGTEYAGKGFSDLMAEGVPLNEVLDLMGVSAGMSDQSLIDMFGSIEAGKAALAMSGKNAEQYTSNLKEMSTQTDVVGDAYEKVSDTFAEKSKKMVENAKNLGIAVYQGMEAPLKQMAESGIDAISQLSSAFETGGLQGLVEEAGSIFADIAVKAAEQAPKMVDAAVGVIQSFVDGIIANRDRLYTAAVDIVMTLAGGVAKLLPSEMRKPAEEAISAITKSLQSGGLKDGIATIMTAFSNLSKAIGNISKVILPPLTKAIELLGKNLDITATAVLSVVAAMKAMTIVKALSTTINKMSGYLKAAAIAAEAYSIQQEAAVITGRMYNVQLTLGQAAVGLFTGKVTLATLAHTALNTVMAANPVWLLVAGIAALGVGLVSYKLFSDDATSGTEQLKGMTDELTASFDTVGESAKTYIDGLASAKSHLSEFDDTLFATNEEQQKLQSNMQEVQSGITTICKTAAGERRGYTEEEIQQLDEYFQKLNELNEREFAIENQKMTAIQQQAVTMAESHSGSLSEYEKVAQEWVKTGQEQADAMSQTVSDQATTEIALLNQKYGDQANMQNGAYAEEYNTILSNKESKLSQIADEQTKISESYSAGYLKRTGLSQEFLQAMNGANTAQEAENERHTQALQDAEKAREELAKGVGTLEASRIYNEQKGMLEEEHAANTASIWSGISENMSEEQGRQLGTWVAMIGDTVTSGGQISEETKNMAVSMIKSLDGLPAGTKAAFEKSIESAVEGCAGYEELKAKAAEQGISFTEALRQSLESGEPEVAQASKDTTEAVSEGAAQADTTTVPVAKAEEATEAQKEALNAGGEGVAQESKATTEKINEGAESADTTTTATAVGTETVQALADSINGLKDIIVGAATSVADGVTEGLSASNVAPTCALIASQVSSGMVTALQGGAVVVNAAGAGLGNAIVEGVTSVGVGDAGVSSANAVALNMINAITNKYGVATMAGAGLANAISTGINSANIGNSGTTVANALTSNLISAINGKVSTATNAGTRLATAVGSGLKSANIQLTAVQIATMFVSSFLSPISGGSSKASSAARSMAGSAGSGLSGYGLGTTGYNTGSNYATSFASGISSSAYKSEVAVKAMATAAKDAANKALGIASPSKEGKRTGRFYGVGLEVGMENEEKNVKNASSKLANAALNGLDIGAIAEKMRNTVAMESAKMSAAITATVNFKVSGAVEAEKQNQSKLMDELAEKIADKLCTKGFGVQCNGREIGRLVGEFAR